jgi:hypothetical protein
MSFQSRAAVDLHKQMVEIKLRQISIRLEENDNFQDPMAVVGKRVQDELNKSK